MELNFKKQLRNYLNKRGMTASELSRRANIPRQNISDWLAGVPPKNIKQIKVVADVLGADFENLLFGEDTQLVSTSGEVNNFLENGEWITGIFEIKIRRIKK